MITSLASWIRSRLQNKLTYRSIKGSELFDEGYYLLNNQDVAKCGIDPLLHYIEAGAMERRNPNPLFSTSFYLDKYADVAQSGINPLYHYILHGSEEGRDPGPYFSTNFYTSKYQDITSPGGSALCHFLKYGIHEGRDPGPFFSSSWYLTHNLDVLSAGTAPFKHFLEYGAAELRDPGPEFLASWYLKNNPDVAAAGWEPLAHYVTHGLLEGRLGKPPKERDDGKVGFAGLFSEDPLIRLCRRYESVGDISASTLLRFRAAGINHVPDRIAPNTPINVFIDDRLAFRPSLIILAPSLQRHHVTGGPNTALIIGALLAQAGISVRVISTDMPLEDNLDFIKSHIKNISGVDPDSVGISFGSAYNRRLPLPIGRRDVFFATAWWTAQMARSAARLTTRPKFIYLIQDYETLFYGASENYADAEATYGFDFFPVVNSETLRDHLHTVGVGCFKDKKFAEGAAVFTPAVNRKHFYASEAQSKRRRRLLFYARPTIAERNLFALGVSALTAGVQQGLFAGTWEFLGMGEAFEAVPLGLGHSLIPAPWLDFDTYAEQMRTADVLLSLMLSPHPSYPPLEMAACGGAVVTTTFGSKTSSRLAQISSSIIGVEPRIDDLLSALERAVDLGQSLDERMQRSNLLQSPSTWVEALSPVIGAILLQLRSDGIVPRNERPQLPPPTNFVVVSEEIEDCPKAYIRSAIWRSRELRSGPAAATLTIVTLYEKRRSRRISDLGQSILGQMCNGKVEWIIVRNDKAKTLHQDVALEQLLLEPSVKLIDGYGLGEGEARYLALTKARGDYVINLQVSDVLFPDTLTAIQTFVEQAGSPSILYSDYDVRNEQEIVGTVVHPDWHPNLFAQGGFEFPILILQTRLALEHCAGEKKVELADLLSRLVTAGYSPSHIRHILFARSQDTMRPPNRDGIGTETFRAGRLGAGNGNGKTTAAEFPVISLPRRVKRSFLAEATSQFSEATLIGIVSNDCEPVQASAMQDAAELLISSASMVMAGGRIIQGDVVFEGAYVFGYQGAIGTPDRGLAVSDDGYMGQLKATRPVAAVSARYAVLRREFLQDCLSHLPYELPAAMLGPWLGALAATTHKQVFYYPSLVAYSKWTLEDATEEDGKHFNAIFGAISDCDPGYPLVLDRSGHLPYQLKTAETVPQLLDYPSFVKLRELTLTTSSLLDASKRKRISVLTVLYERSNCELFRRTAASVQAQSWPPCEWVVLAQGPISNELEELLLALEAGGTLRLLRSATNMGISKGLRYCLEQATGEMATWIDGDDLITADAVEAVEAALADRTDCAILYSDEDLLINNIPRHPYYRPDFDPVLLLSHSFAWHLIVFNRVEALRLDAFSSDETQFAQDWDILVRFYLAGHKPYHLPKTLYHWRQHPDSVSNSGTTFDGSLRSIKAILSSIIQETKEPRLYEISPYPLELGAPDYFLERLPKSPPSVQWLRASPGTSIDFTFSEITDAEFSSGPQGLIDLEAVLEHGISDFVFITGPDMNRVDAMGLWQAIKHCELVCDCVAVGGPLTSVGSNIVRGALVSLTHGRLTDETAGRSIHDPGPFSLAMKPHCVFGLPADLLFVKRSFLTDALRNRPVALAVRSLAAWLGTFAALNGLQLVYEPLLRGRTGSRGAVLSDDIDGVQLALEKVILPHLQQVTIDFPSRGLANFEVRAGMHMN